MPGRGASHYRVRSIAVAVVFGGHVALLALLALQRAEETSPSVDERMTLIFLAPPTDARRPPSIETSPDARDHPSPPAPLPEPVESTAPAIVIPHATPTIDWYAHGADAAQRAVSEPT